MKKLIAAIVIASVGASFAATTSDLVYDYKASIKRLDLQLQFVKKAAAVAEKYNVVSDTIYGYVTLPACASCAIGDLGSSIGNANTGNAYLVLKGNKYAKDSAHYIYKTPVTAAAGVFGAQTYTSGAGMGDPINPKQLNKAWMALDYVMPKALVNNTLLKDLDPADMLKGLGSDPNNILWNAFFGPSNTGNNDIEIYNTGFGTATTMVTKSSSAYTICGSDVTPGTSCTIVNTISGTLVGYPRYLGPCGVTAIWDVCMGANTVTDPVTQETTTTYYYKSINESVISGTWSLKYNKKLTSLLDANAQEIAILKNLGYDLNAVKVDKEGTVTAY